MEVPPGLVAQFEPFLGSLMLALGRLSPIVLLMPGIGDQFLSARVKLFVLLALSISLLSTGVVPSVQMDPLASFLPILFVEVAIGLKMGVLLRATVWILMIVGNVIANMIGLSQLMGVATHSESQTVLANLLAMAGTTLLLTLNFHVMVFSEVVRSYGEPTTLFDMGANANVVANALARAFTFAIVLAWPFVAVSIIYNLCLGFINRAMPQLMVAFVGAPFMIGSGFILLVASISGILLIWQDRAMTLLELGMG